MLKMLQKKDTAAKILFGFVIGVVGIMLIITLVPGAIGVQEASPDVLATVGKQEITASEVTRRLNQVAGRQQIPDALRGIYMRQVLNQLVSDRLFEAEAERLGIRVTEEEQAERIKRMLPSLAGDTFVGKDRYAAEVSARFNLSVPEFEDLIRKSLLEDRFRRLVTDGVTVTPDEVQTEFKRRNQKVKLDYVLLKPEDLEAKIAPSEDNLKGYFEKNKGRYQLPERRVTRFAVLDQYQVAAKAGVTDAELRAYYNEHISEYHVRNRAHVSHILFKTAGKTDAEIQEIQKKAEGVLRQARSGAKFDELAKKFSEDTSKDKGGDLGWIVREQTVPEFEQASFTLPIGKVSDLVRTQFGFHIIKVTEREDERTRSFEEVRGSILPTVTMEKAERLAQEKADQMTAAVRRAGNRPLDDIAREFGLTLGETRPLGAGEPVVELGGKNNDVEAEIFRLNKGQLSLPIKTLRGYAILSLKESLPARQANLEDVRDKVIGDYRKEKSIEMAKSRAEELAKAAQGGTALAAAAKAQGLEVKSSEPIARNGSIPGVGGARQLPAAFTMQPGQTSGATGIGSNWVVYRVADREEAKPEEFDKQKGDIEKALLATKKSNVWEAFRDALEARMKQDGTLKMNEANLKRLSGRAGL